MYVSVPRVNTSAKLTKYCMNKNLIKRRKWNDKIITWLIKKNSRKKKGA